MGQKINKINFDAQYCKGVDINGWVFSTFVGFQLHTTGKRKKREERERNADAVQWRW